MKKTTYSCLRCVLRILKSWDSEWPWQGKAICRCYCYCIFSMWGNPFGRWLLKVLTWTWTLQTAVLSQCPEFCNCTGFLHFPEKGVNEKGSILISGELFKERQGTSACWWSHSPLYSTLITTIQLYYCHHTVAVPYPNMVCSIECTLNYPLSLFIHSFLCLFSTYSSIHPSAFYTSRTRMDT